MLPPRLLRSRTLVAGNLVLIAAGMSVDGLLFILTLYTQRVLGYSPLRFGSVTAIMTVSSVGASYLAQRAVTRFGHRPVTFCGMTMLGLTCLGFAAATTRGGEPAVLIASMLGFGLGMGCAFVAGTVASLTDVPERDSGIAAGVQNVSFGLGTTLGVAALSTVAAAVTRHVQSRPGSAGVAGALTSGYHAAFLTCALIALLGLAAAGVSSGRSRARQTPESRVRLRGGALQQASQDRD
jgi:MFS family permease